MSFLKLFKKGDFVVVLAVGLFIALLFFLGNALGGANGAGYATVELNNQEVLAFSLVSEGGGTENVHVPLENGEAILEIIDGQVRVLPMPREVCPLQVWSSVGFIDKPGQAIVCLPNRMVVTIVGETEDPYDLDGITN